MSEYPDWLYDEHTDDLYGVGDEAYLEPLPAPAPIEAKYDIPF